MDQTAGCPFSFHQTQRPPPTERDVCLVVIYNIARTTMVDDPIMIYEVLEMWKDGQISIYEVLEMWKDGQISSGKYESCVIPVMSMHVVVFSISKP